VEAGGFRRHYETLAKAGAEVIGVSTDSEEKSAAFRKELGLPFPLVADPAGRIVREWGVRWPIVGLARRVTFVIGRDRKVARRIRSETDAASHVREALEAVAALG